MSLFSFSALGSPDKALVSSDKGLAAASLPGGCFLGFLGLAAVLAGCAGPAPQRVGRGHGREYFSSEIYGAASPRVVADGQPIPRGGGQYLLGHPYTIAGRTYYPHAPAPGSSEVGLASWYGGAFNGRRTANGEVYDMNSVSAAHPTMPLPSYARVTNLGNGRSIIVRVNDRGPYHASRVMDVSSRVADALDFKRFGTAEVRVEYIGPASLAGSDDAMLMASLRTDGRPATLPGMPDVPQTMFASAGEPAAPPEPPAPSLVPLFSFGARPQVAQRPEVPRVAPTRPSETYVPRTPPTMVAAASLAPAQIVPARPGALPIRVPLPPSRPFDLDLGTIPGADVPIAAAPRLRQTSALFYASPPRLRALPPFRHLDTLDEEPFSSQQ